MQDCNGREIKIGDKVRHKHPYGRNGTEWARFMRDRPPTSGFPGTKEVKDFASSTCIVTWPPDREHHTESGKVIQYIVPNVYLASFLEVVE